MKSTTALTITVVALASFATADMLKINNPTDGTVWTTGVFNFVGWEGNCASMGNDAKTVKVDLVNGPSTAVRYVATLGTLDCSGSNTRADMTVPSSVASGQYAIVVRTSPEQSYTNSFQINNPSSPAPPAPVPVAPTSGSGSGSGSGSSSGQFPSSNTSSGAVALKSVFGSGFMVALAGAAMAFQLL
ncbi:hypothetical protein EMPS_03500 [Entomortierella parvispora]|uniref:Uncharacterized protein n=1 Tax=Entomortierella parvispora TaxID=205924 RepID=A0A9P3H6Y1_9FUNG|nr:hypothetical protein EMPS_03500 [Entomortierella parvispora]